MTIEPRVVCPGWAGVHSEPIVLREGSEPVSHGLCLECQKAVDAESDAFFTNQAGADPSKMVSFDQAHKTGDHDISKSS